MRRFGVGMAFAAMVAAALWSTALWSSALWAAAPAAGAPNSVDLTASAGSASGTVGSTVAVRVQIGVKGGQYFGYGVTQEFKAPPGTELVGLSDSSGGDTDGFGRGCDWVTKPTDITCSVGFGDTSQYLAIKIDGAVSGTGSFTVSCRDNRCDDPDPDNNTASITITVKGAASPKPTKAAKPKPKPSPTPSATPSPTPEPTVPSATPSADPSANVVAYGPSNDDPHRSNGANGILVTLAGLGVVAVGAAAFWAQRRFPTR